MSTRPPVQVIAAPRKRLRKLLIFALFGIVLGLLVVLFLARVYNPFEEGIGDHQLLVLAPPDADLLVFIPRVPKFLGELRDRQFSHALAESERFQRFIRSDFARKTGAVEGLSSAFSELDLLRSRPPLGLDLWQDISGDALLFAGYAPVEGQPWQFIAMFRPNSWKVIAAVNVLVDPILGDLPPIRNALEAAGVKKVERFRDSVTLTFTQGPPMSLARILNVVVVGTEVDRITRLKTTIERDRLPSSPVARYADLVPGAAASAHEVRAVVRRRVADAQLHLTDRMNEKWGPDNVSLLEATLPRFGGEDLLLALSVDEALDLRIRMLEGAPRQNDLGKSFRRFDRDDASVAFKRAAPLLPDSTFAFAHLKVDVMQFLDAFFQRPEVFSAADRGNLAEALKSIKGVDDIPGLKNKLAEICDGKVSIGFFKQDPRDVLDKAAAGYFVAWHLQNEKELRAVLDSVSATIRERSQSGEKSVIRDLVHTQKGGVDLYEIVLPAGVVDDPRVTKLGLVIGRGLLIVTNFIPSFRPLMQVASVDDRILPAEATVTDMIDHGPDAMRLGCAISGDAIYQYFDQAAEGWAVAQTTPSGRTEAQWNGQAEMDARARGLKDGTLEFKRFVDDAYQRNLDKLIKIDRPQIRRDIERYLGDLRGVVRAIGFFIGEGDGLELGVRIEVAEKPR